MSFGDGNLHVKCADLEKANADLTAERDQRKRTLGGTQAALNRSRQRERELETLVLDMLKVLHVPNGETRDKLVDRAIKIGIEV